jgi:hypothetical protein
MKAPSAAPPSFVPKMREREMVLDRGSKCRVLAVVCRGH